MAKTRVPVQRPADTEHEILPLIAGRWSPRAFDSRPVETDKLLRLLDAARWSASCFNEQPWRFFLATKDDAHRPMLEAFLVDGNAWARSAPLLMLTAAHTLFARNDQPNRVALHDVGLACANLVIQAVHEGLCAHGMAGFSVERAKADLQLPDHLVPVAMWAIGYPGFVEDLPSHLQAREMAPRTRRRLEHTVFAGSLEQAHPLVKPGGGPSS
jgi:nitroreductase